MESPRGIAACRRVCAFPMGLVVADPAHQPLSRRATARRCKGRKNFQSLAQIERRHQPRTNADRRMGVDPHGDTRRIMKSDRTLVAKITGEKNMIHHAKNLLKLQIACALIVLLNACSSIPSRESPELQTVPYVDLERYLGKWYEIALYPNWFEEGCFASTAFYEKMKDGRIRVINQCRTGGPQGELKEAIGTAEIADTQSNAKLKVQFFWPFKGNYWIVDLDKDYQHVIVSEPKRQYLWILSRSPEMNPETLKKLKMKIKEKGFDLSHLEATKY